MPYFGRAAYIKLTHSLLLDLIWTMVHNLYLEYHVFRGSRILRRKPNRFLSFCSHDIIGFQLINYLQESLRGSQILSRKSLIFLPFCSYDIIGFQTITDSQFATGSHSAIESQFTTGFHSKIDSQFIIGFHLQNG